MKKTLILAFVLIHGIVCAQSFRDFLSRISSLNPSNRQAVADSFMRSGIQVPLTEQDTLVHFLYNAPALSVSMAGDATGWKPSGSFSRIEGTHFWYFTTVCERDARLDYKLVIDGKEWIPDPSNPAVCQGGFGPNSELRMPGNSPPPETTDTVSIPHGILKEIRIPGSRPENDRLVRIYLPIGYPSIRKTYPVILFHDGLDYLNTGQAGYILDYLIHTRLIVPVIAIFVPPVDRDPEYSGKLMDQFSGFITQELMPYIDKNYLTSRVPLQRAMIGASNGGNISLYIGLHHPDQFGLIAAQSSNVIPEIMDEIKARPRMNLTFYLDIGRYDIEVLIPRVKNLHQLLENKEYECLYFEWNEGHSWCTWREHLRHPLMFFFNESFLRE